MAKDEKLGIQGVRHDRVSALEIVMLYPLGFASIEPHQIAPTRNDAKKRTRLAMTADEARSIGEQFLQLAKSIEEAGGSKQ